MSKEDISEHVPAYGVIASWVRYCPDKQDQLPAYLEEVLTFEDVLSSPEHLQAFREDLTKWRTSDENSWPIGVRNMQDYENSPASVKRKINEILAVDKLDLFVCLQWQALFMNAQQSE